MSFTIRVGKEADPRFFLFQLFLTHEDLDRRAVEIPLGAYLVFKEAAVRLLYPLRKITEEYECRDNRVLEHRDVFDLHKLALVAWGWRNSDFLKHVGIELRGRNHTPTVFIHLYSSLKDVEDTLFCER